jgi:serine protease AprX
MHARIGPGSRRLLTLVAVGSALAAAAGGVAPQPPPRAAGVAEAVGRLVPVMLGERQDAVSLARAVERVGGRVTRPLGLIDAQAALVPDTAVAGLAADPAVSWTVPDSSVRLAHAAVEDGVPTDLALGPGSGFHIADTVRAKPLWERGLTGAGVDVAVIDSGVVPVDGLSAPGKVVDGPDLSFDSGDPALRHLDAYGHGTHIAGLVAGRGSGVPTPVGTPPHDAFVGIAPDARVVNLKVADARGATDVSQVIAAIDWVVQHGRSGGLNIRVLNLSFGTDGVQDYRLDPLSHAIERAWHRGLVVVASAGNAGYGDARVDNPATNPWVIAVGGSDSRGTVRGDDDVVAGWSSRGDERRRPDLVAPGQSVVSLRSPGSHLDQEHPQARVGQWLFRGSGTSQSAGVVSGAAALLLQQRPQLAPDQVKALLMRTARFLPEADPAAQGAGLLDVAAAAKAGTPQVSQTWTRSLGTGSLEAARGSAHVAWLGEEVVGERSVFLSAWDSASWAGDLLGGVAPAEPWSGGAWTGNSWSGNSWSGGTWMGNSWSGNSWSGNSWSGNSWSGNSWSGNSWSGNSWSGNSWSSAEW